MRKLTAFLRRFRVFLVFLILQILALSTYFSIMSYPRTRFFNSSSSIVARMLTWERNVTKYLYLDQENVRLQEVNAELERLLPSNYIPIDTNVSIINDTVRKLTFERIPATVINSSHAFTNNYFTINAGTEKGVERKMGVISNEGVVGIVYDVSKHYAVVKSILTEDINISAIISNSNAYGLIKYSGEDPRNVNLTGISNDIKIENGIGVVTRGSGGYFPQGIPIGTVEKLEPIEGKPMWDITVKLAQDMRSLRYVYVVKNLLQYEIDELENNIQELKN